MLQTNQLSSRLRYLRTCMRSWVDVDDLDKPGLIGPGRVPAQHDPKGF